MLMEDTQIIRKILTTSIFDVFEKMFFIFLEISRMGKRQYDLVTAIRFSGPIEGEIRLCLSDSLALVMVQNMLSMRQCDVTREMKEDCAKEAANMIGGVFLRTLDNSKIFQLTVPVCLPITSAVQQDIPGPDLEQWLNVESENGYLGIVVSLKDYGITFGKDQNQLPHSRGREMGAVDVITKPGAAQRGLQTYAVDYVLPIEQIASQIVKVV
jgi:CheY-specific phosphatase CheX